MPQPLLPTSPVCLLCASSELRTQGSGETERGWTGTAPRCAVSDGRNTPGAGGSSSAVFAQMELVLRMPSWPPVLIRNVHAQNCFLGGKPRSLLRWHRINGTNAWQAANEASSHHRLQVLKCTFVNGRFSLCHTC